MDHFALVTPRLHQELEAYAQSGRGLSMVRVFSPGERVTSATLADLGFDLDRLFAE